VRQLQAELDEEEKDRRLLAALDEARLAQAETLSVNRFASERAVPKFREAVRAYGLAAGEGEPKVAAERIRQRPAAVREAIIATLDEGDALAGDPRYEISEPHREWLRAMLEAAGPDDAWSRKVRAARRETEAAKRRAALEVLAQSARVAELPARALTRLARGLRPAQAAALLRRAQGQYPADFWVNNDLGFRLQKVTPPEREEAVRFLTAAVALRPESPGAHYNLGTALYEKDRLDEAIACYQKAIELDQKYASAHTNLGNALHAKGQVDEAIACFEKALALDPKLAPAHNNLGPALNRKGRYDEAIACFKKAIEFEPTHALAHCNLGRALRQQGRFAESLRAYQRGHELGTKQPGWPYPSAEWLREAESMAAMESKLPAFLKGEFQPKDTAERRGLAEVCYAKGLRAATVRLYADAFAADPRLADDLAAAHRSYAACSAALAAAGQGEDAGKLDDKEKARLRKQARDRLRADLALRIKQLESGKPADRAAVQQALRHWQQDSDLAGLRDAAALAPLPAEESATCAKLWADVAALLEKAEEKAAQDQQLAQAGQLAQRGLALLQEQKWAEAEPLIRQSLAIRQKMQPDAWTTFNTQSLLGGALLGQQKYADAEPLLLAGYEGMKQRQQSIPPPGKVRLPEAALRLVQLYEALGKKDEAMKWQKEREAIQAAQQIPQRQL
jgi:tetratricopeptide (TPR) repeat protein